MARCVPCNQSLSKRYMKIHYNLSHMRLLLMALCMMMGVGRGVAFDTGVYAGTSVLATGQWVRVSIPESGVYRLTPARLRAMGFSDPGRVRVFGYGGRVIGDRLSQADYKDDLPPVQTMVAPDGSVLFYGVGPETWATATTGRFVRSGNVYSTTGKYFVTEAAPGDTAMAVPAIEAVGHAGGNFPVTSFWNRMQHEVDLVSPGQAGPQLVGEDFKYTPGRTFSFDLPDRIDDDKTGVWFECSFVAHTLGQTSQLVFTANGQEVPFLSTDRVSATPNDEHYHGTEAVTRHTLPTLEGNRLNLDIRHQATGTVHGAWLNYLAVNYQRKLKMPRDNGPLTFWLSQVCARLEGATPQTVLWDVTVPGKVMAVNTGDLDGDRLTWTNSYTGWRTYVAFDPASAALPEPDVEGRVSNQDLHGSLWAGVPDMAIVTPAAFKAQALRLAGLHARDPHGALDVRVYDLEQIYNEFGSGVADASAIRRFFKMMWDLGRDGAPTGYESRLRYGLLMGRATFDNRHLVAEAHNFAPLTIPCWWGGNMRQSLNDTDGYGTDDFLAMLGDNSGNDKGLDDLKIAIGRIPARTAQDAALYVDKLEQYMFKSGKTGWKNRVMLLADDADQGVHMTQAESMNRWMEQVPGNPLLTEKVYMDAYTKSSGAYPQARETMFRLLDEGVVWWTYIGHANDHSLSHDGQLTYNDLNNMFYKHVPVFYAATCDFLRWDQPSMSGGEIMFFERYGGAISIISATRPVYIYENGLLSNAVGRHMGARDARGKLLTVGEIYRRAKNNILTDKGQHLTNPNRLKYVLMGDPAMRLSTPDLVAGVDSIGGRAVSDLDDMSVEPVVLAGMQTAVVTGTVTDASGQPVTDFDGTVTVTLYDALESVTSNGYDDSRSEGEAVTFDRQGTRLFAGSAPVKDGRYSVRVAVPVDIADNYRPAALSLYACGSADERQAGGLERRLYVSGFDDSAGADTVAPVIEWLRLNHETWTPGGMVNPTPMLLARVSDDVALNLSTSGIGHSMAVTIDGNNTLEDVSQYYTPSPDGTPSGTIAYPLPGLKDGAHTLRLRVWDTSANSAVSEVDFTVDSRLAPVIYDVYTDANPAVDRANFYVTHDRPDAMSTVTVNVYNLLGSPVWSGSVKGMSDLGTSAPVSWDLTDTAGRRVPRGIYVYRATITTDDGKTYDTASRRLAVAAN